MSKERKIRIKSDRSVLKIIKNVFIGFLMFALLSAVSSIIIIRSNLELANIKYFFIIALLVSSFIASLLAAYSIRNMKGLIAGLLTSFLLTMIILLITVIINAGQLSTIGFSLFLCSTVVGAPAGIIGANLKQ